MITRFEDGYSFLSNFCPANVMYDGYLYLTGEHAFVAAKTLDLDTRIAVSKISTPGRAKKFGRKLDLRPDWELVKVPIMHQIILDKFTRNPELRTKLLATGDKELIEGNHWGDTFWGMIYSQGTLRGENHLGKILMEVREELK